MPNPRRTGKTSNREHETRHTIASGRREQNDKTQYLGYTTTSTASASELPARTDPPTVVSEARPELSLPGASPTPSVSSSELSLSLNEIDEANDPTTRWKMSDDVCAGGSPVGNSSWATMSDMTGSMAVRFAYCKFTRNRETKIAVKLWIGSLPSELCGDACRVAVDLTAR